MAIFFGIVRQPTGCWSTVYFDRCSNVGVPVMLVNYLLGQISRKEQIDIRLANRADGFLTLGEKEGKKRKKETMSNL